MASGPPRELLVVHLPARGADDEARLLDALRRFGVVTQRLPPRLLLLAAGPEASLDEIDAVNGVVEVLDGAVPARVSGTLAEAERIFVDAWLARADAGGTPPGDGLPWDSPGRLPPDLPFAPVTTD